MDNPAKQAFYLLQKKDIKKILLLDISKPKMYIGENQNNENDKRRWILIDHDNKIVFDVDQLYLHHQITQILRCMPQNTGNSTL